jgi:ElaB/YqjD/DUF883 family membrane-anchored ribosome-binding protein
MPDKALVHWGAGGLQKPASLDDEIRRLEADILSRRQRVAASLGELRRRVGVSVSWRHWVGAHPLACVGTALAVGFIIGRGTTRAR